VDRERRVATQKGWLAAGVGLAALGAHYGVVLAFAPALRLSLGWVLFFPLPTFVIFVSWALCGTLAAAALGVWLVAGDGAEARWATIERFGRRGSDRAWIVATSVLAFAAAVAVRYGVLHGAAVTDDETAYLFAARLLAAGKLSVPSPPLKLFFDHGFFINDGRLRPFGFLGWPALMAPGVWLGIPGLMNAVYFAASVPPLFLSARTLLGSAWARLALLLWVSSPFLIALAATGLSHTSCLATLAWAFWLFLETRSGRRRAAPHALLAAALSVAFFVRPLSGLGLGAPLAILWVRDRWRERQGRAAAVAAFALVAVAFAAAFLGVQARQSGSPWKTGYQRAVEYQEENGYRFSSFGPGNFTRFGMVEIDRPLRALTNSISGWERLLLDLGGWPFWLLLGLLLALLARGTGLLWGVFAGGAASVVLINDPGIDSFGPTHYAELSLPVILLFVAGVREAAARLGERDKGPAWPRERLRALPVAICLAGVLTAWAGWVPVRWATLSQIGANTLLPERAVARAGVGRAVVFASYPWIWPPCVSEPARHFRYLRPVSDPELTDRVLWVNHVILEEDRAFMEQYPDREGYAIAWAPDCTVRVIPLREATAAELPPALPQRWW